MSTSVQLPFEPALLLFLAAWSTAWKGVALWHAARNAQGAWYVALLVLQTAGLLEIVYLLFFRPKRAGA